MRLRNIKAVIRREKVKHPEKSDIVILFNEVIGWITLKLDNVRMKFSKDSTFTSKQSIWMSSLLPQKVLDLVIEKINPRSVLDVGCGTGVSVSYFLKKGVDATGIENSKLAIAQAENPERIIRHNLKKEISLGRVFDLVWCFEVIEHIHPDFEANFLKTLTIHGDLIILSAAHPGQGGHGHFNEQTSEYWIEKFANLNFSYDPEFTDQIKATKDMHTENVLVFRRN